MNNFRFYAPTDIRFGKGQADCLPEELGKYGKRILMVYGGGSVKRSGLYDRLQELLKEFEIFELPGIEPNPKITSVRKGVEICKKEQIDVILAVGGGSCIDASKNIACGAFYEGDPWDLVLDRTKITKALPLAVVLTICATGSEMNNGAVISNEETNEKLEMGADVLYPKLSVCDPAYLYTLPPAQTAAGTADIMSHVLEQYFQPCDTAWLTDRLSEEVLKTCIRYCPVALEEPENYEARANLMWASTLGLNHILTAGKGGAWSCHPMEHQLSAFYDITHGAGLAILTPAWMRYVLCDRTAGRFALYARQVWDVEAEDDYQAAEEGICCTESFFRKIGLPSTLSEVGIGREHFREMAEKAVEVSGIAARSYYHLGAEDIVKIFESCLG